MRHAATKHIYAHWRRLKGRRAAPERQEFNPADIGRHLGDLLLLESAGQGGWTFRIAGSRLCALYGSELRGRAFTKILLPQADEDAEEMLNAASVEGHPVIAGVTLMFVDGTNLGGELLLLPLLHEGRLDTRMLGALTFRPQDRLASGLSAGMDILSFRVLREEFGNPGFHAVDASGPLDAAVLERRGHLTVLRGGLHQA